MIVFHDDLPVSHLPGKMPPSGAKELTSHSCVDEDSVMSDTTAFRMVGLSLGFSFVQSPANFTICTQKNTQRTNFSVGEEVITDKDLCTRHYGFSASTPQLRKKFYLGTTFIIRRGFFHVCSEIKFLFSKRLECRFKLGTVTLARHQCTLILDKQFA